MYTEANNGGGSGAIFSNAGYRLTSAGTGAGDDVDLRTSGIAFMRDPFKTGRATRSLVWQSQFVVRDTTNAEGFIGLLETDAQLSALPTTTRHVGVFWDISASPNYFLTSADGTTQTTTDTGVAVSTAFRKVKLNWTSLTNIVLQFITVTASTGAETVNSTQTVTAAPSSNEAGLQAHWFVQTEAAATKRLDIYGWQVDWK
jgi:hypothetical protein